MNLIELYNVIEHENVKVDLFEMKENEAFSMPDTIVIDPKKIKGEQDEKIKIAHGLGHCMTGSFYNSQNPLDVRTKHERRADKWAIKNLIGADELYNAVASGYTELWELAEHFDITEEYMKKIVCYYEGWEW